MRTPIRLLKFMIEKDLRLFESGAVTHVTNSDGVVLSPVPNSWLKLLKDEDKVVSDDGFSWRPR